MLIALLKELRKRGKFLFPIIKRVFPSLVVNDIVAIQPMTMPTTPVFMLNWNSGSNGDTEGCK